MNRLYNNYSAKKIGMICFTIYAIAMGVNFFISLLCGVGYGVVGILSAVVNIVAGVCLLVYSYKYLEEDDEKYYQIGTMLFIVITAICLINAIVVNLINILKKFSIYGLIALIVNIVKDVIGVTVYTLALLISNKDLQIKNTQKTMDTLFITQGSIGIIGNLLVLIISLVDKNIQYDNIGALISNAIFIIIAIVVNTLGYMFLNNHILIRIENEKKRSLENQSIKKEMAAYIVDTEDESEDTNN